MVAGCRRHGGHPAKEARCEEKRRLRRHAPALEQVRARRPSCCRISQHRERREKAGEHDDVAQEEYPEAVACDHPAGGRPALAVTRCIAAPAPIRRWLPASEFIRIDEWPRWPRCECLSGTHTNSPVLAF